MARWWPWGGSGAGPEPVDPPSVPAPAPAPVQRAWQSLPPMTPAVAPTRPIAPLDAFTSSLATQRDPSFLAPLGHIVDPDGPSGHVDGLAGPVVPQTVSTGPDMPVAPRRRSSIASTVQRLIEPRVRFSDTSASSAAAPVSAPTPDPGPAVTVARSVAEPEAERDLVETDVVDAAPAVESVSWSLPAVSANSPAVRPMPLVSAPRQEPVVTLPAVSAPAPSVQRAPAGPDRPTTAGENTGTPPDVMSTAPLAGDVVVPTVSRVTTDPAGSGVAAGPVPHPDSDVRGAAGRVQRAIADPAGAPVSFAEPSPMSTPSPMSEPPPMSRPTAADPAAAAHPSDHTPTVTAESAASPEVAAPASDSALPVVPTLSAPSTSATPGMTGSSAGPSMQRQTDSTAAPAANPGSGPRSSGLGAPLTAVPTRPQETVVREPQPMDFASIQRIIESAAATGSTEIALPTAAPSGSDPRVAPTVGMPAPRAVPGGSRPAGLGAPLTSGVVPAAVQRTVEGSPRSPAATTPEHPVQRAVHAPAAGSSTGATQRTGSADDHLAPVPHAEPAPEPEVAVMGAEPVVAPTLGADTAAASGPVAEVGQSDPTAALPELALAGSTHLQRLADTPAPPAPLMLAPLLGDTSPYRPTPTHPAVPAAPGVSAGPVLPAVQRFGLPGVSSLVDKATSTVGGLAKSAQGAAGGYLNQAQGLAGGLQDRASGYANQAQQAASGYVNQAQGLAGGYLSQARQAAGGYVDQAQGAAGGLADSAAGYLHSAQGAAAGAVSSATQAADSALGSASSAAGGVANQLAGAASGAADQASGAVGQASGAVGQASGALGHAASGAADAASGAADAVTGAAGGAMHAATGAIGAATGAAGAAAAGAAGAAAGIGQDALPTNLDELARRLFDPLSARLKSELWMDRERAGMVTDLRR